jgi:D-alanyl-D-alanine carboxypeptidase
MSKLLGSVGDGGRNIPSDVKAVQYLLSVRGMNPGAIDSVCGKKTISAIEHFQAGFMSQPDGLVESEGMTWGRLAGHGRPPSASPAPATPRAAAPRPTPAVPAPTRPAATAAPVQRPANASLSQLVPLPPRSSYNQGLSSASNSYMIQKLGKPRPEGGYTQAGGPVTNEKLKKAMVYGRDIGPFKVSGLAGAVASLTQVMSEVRLQFPDVFNSLATGGMLNCRLQRGSTTAISNHSWGSAIDLGLKGHGVDPRGDNKVYFGLTLIAPIFNRHGWYWGAGFRTEDAMHFEGSKTLIDQWAGALV